MISTALNPNPDPAAERGSAFDLDTDHACNVVADRAVRNAAILDGAVLLLLLAGSVTGAVLTMRRRRGWELVDDATWRRTAQEVH